MKFLSYLAGAMSLALATCAAPVLAQNGSSVQFPAGWAPGQSICVKQPDKTCVPVSADNPLPVTGGGGGAGDASASNQVITNNRLGDVSAPATGSVNQRLGLINTTLVSLFQSGGSIGNTAFGISGALPAFAITPTFNLGSGGIGTPGSPIYTASNTATTGAPGVTAPTNAQQVGGVGPTGNLRAISTDTRGGLMPGQGVVASVRTSVTASTATQISASVTGRVGLSVFTEAALTANVFLCTTQATACSATSYDFLIPSGASAGTIYTSIFAPNGTIYAFSTAASVLVVNNWTAQ